MIPTRDRLLPPEQRIRIAAARASATQGFQADLSRHLEGPEPTRIDWLFCLVDDPDDDVACRRLRRIRAVAVATILVIPWVAVLRLLAPT